MPRNKRSMNLSAIVSLLIEIFLPSLRQKYLFTNFECSTENRKYKDYIPFYLHNRPREVILHCLDRKASSARFTIDDVVLKDDDKGIFEVYNAKRHAYQVDFTAPSCSCPDWIEHHYPCKHFFAIFCHHSKWTWEALPQTYLSSPRMSLDNEALQNYFGPDSTPLAIMPDQNSTSEMSGDSIPRRMVSKNLKIRLKWNLSTVNSLLSGPLKCGHSCIQAKYSTQYKSTPEKRPLFQSGHLDWSQWSPLCNG